MIAAGPLPIVLVVDDEVLLRLVATQALQDAGCATFEAGEAEEALLVLEQHPEISVLFTDINMPGERDGLALVQVVREKRPDLRVIITSGREQPRPAALPADGRFIPKPYSLELVVDLVKSSGQPDGPFRRSSS